MLWKLMPENNIQIQKTSTTLKSTSMSQFLQIRSFQNTRWRNKNSIPTGKDARKSTLESYNDREDFKTIDESEEVYLRKPISEQDRVNIKRKSYEHKSKNKKPLLPMLLKFKENGITVDLTHSPLKRKTTVKDSKHRINRESSFQDAFDKVNNESTYSKNHTTQGHSFDKFFKETLSYFHPNPASKVSIIA
jgi:hypothetical protein